MIKIVTDSTAYLTEPFVREHDIRVVPLYVHFGEEAFREGVELSNEEFYAKLKEAPQLPTTSQPSAGEFYEVFKELTDAGHEVVTLTISSKLSGTWNSAMAAKEMLSGMPISVIDSLSTSAGRSQVPAVRVKSETRDRIAVGRVFSPPLLTGSEIPDFQSPTCIGGCQESAVGAEGDGPDCVCMLGGNGVALCARVYVPDGYGFSVLLTDCRQSSVRIKGDGEFHT